MVNDGSICPWIFPRAEVRSDLNHPVKFRTYVVSRDSYIRNIAVPRLGIDPGMSVKEFLQGFPSLPDSADRSQIFDYLSTLTEYCIGAAVYIPPPHTHSQLTHSGAWYMYLPAHCKTRWSYYDSVLKQALCGKTANLSHTDSLKHLLRETSGYHIIRELALAAGHPALAFNRVEVDLPIQRTDTTLQDYLFKWLHYLHIGVLRGIFLSDRYFLECFIRNLSPIFNGNLKPLLFNSLRSLPVNDRVPHMWQPDHLLSYVRSLAENVGVHSITPLLTPREFSQSSSRGPPRTPRTRTNPVTPRPVRQLVDIRQIQDLDDDIYCLVASLASANTRSCDFCGSEAHLLNGCSKLAEMAKDKFKVKRLVRTLEDIQARRGGASVSSQTSTNTQTSTRTPTSSNRTTPIRSLQSEELTADDTDDDITVSRLTDDEATDDEQQDFP